ncbi:MAG: ImmA/IrrE family metallo-endopeptidase [Planctomycetes bacterium]|nr:ImmA/IrrE family metallo-endopeptidase [Planctomycetota bacterium]
MPRIRANITPDVMEWARKSCGYCLDDAASKIGRSVEEVSAWESGELQPTIPQARKASEVYKRPLAVFFLPEPPEDFQTLRDFRRLPSDYSSEFSPHLNFLVRQTQDRQQWLRDYLRFEEMPQLGFIGSANLTDNVLKLAKTIRTMLGVTVDDVRRCRGAGDALRLWINKAEELGVFVFRGGSYSYEQIDIIEARGFALTDDYAPFIFLNAQDAKAGQIFTLIHELAHLWLNISGISNLVAARRATGESDRIEIFCNAVSAEVLVPQKCFSQRWRRVIMDKTVEEGIDSSARHFNVSREVIARRLLTWGKITNRKYRDLAQMFVEEWHANKILEKERQSLQDSRPNYYVIKSMNNGHSFCKIVIGAYQNGQLSGRDTSNLLGVKINKLVGVANAVNIPFATVGGGI